MTRTELAEAMIDGSLGYKPTDDAVFMAEGYINLSRLMEMTKNHLPKLERELVDQFLNFDPAKAV